MQLNRKKIFLVIAAILLIVLAIGLLSFYLIYTTNGSRFVVKTLLAKYASASEVNIKSVDGTLAKKISFKEIEIKKIKGLPVGTMAKIEELEVYFSSINLEGLNIEIQSGRLLLPDSDPILFYGGYRYGSLNLSVYSKQVSVRSILDLFEKNSVVKNITGTIKNIDIDTQGSFLEPTLIGNFYVEKLAKDGFILHNTHGAFNITLKDVKEFLKIYGEVNLEGGTVAGNKTAIVQVKLAEFTFLGIKNNTSIHFVGSSTVENTKINIVMNGPLNSPDLKLESEPPLPQERLLLMLATGRTWKQTEKALNKDKISADVAADFVDYFLFSGTGSKIAQSLGVNDISFTVDDKSKGLEVIKSISDKVDATYGVNQIKEENETVTIHKVGGEYAITDQISVGAQREIKQTDSKEKTESTTPLDEKIYLKYKQKF